MGVDARLATEGPGGVLSVRRGAQGSVTQQTCPDTSQQ